MKELRTEAEKFVESILAYPTQINFTKSELTQYLLDFHAQQSKERGIITPKEFILSKYPDANFEDKNGFINGNFWKGIESMISEYCALTK